MSRTVRAIERAWRDGGALATLLRPLGALNGRIVAVRTALHRTGRLAIAPSALPVVVVGNITVGGTGKTPLTARLVGAFRDRGWRPGIVSRGYGGARHERARHVRADDLAIEVGDEPLMLHRASGAPVCVCVHRARAVAALAADTDCDLVLSDDGLQHLRMARDAEIVVVDGESGFGNGRLLPAGPLREPPERLRAADLIAVRVPSIDASFERPTVASAIVAAMGAGAPSAADLPPTFAFATSRPRVRRWPDGAWRGLDDWRGREVHALAGIARPERFFELLRAHGLVVDPRPLPDHHVPTADDLSFGDGSPVFVTSKDAVKLDAMRRHASGSDAAGEGRADAAPRDADGRPVSVYEVAVEIALDPLADELLDALSARLRERDGGDTR